MREAEVLTVDNWRRAVRHAVDALPPDIRPGVAYGEPHAKAAQPHDSTEQFPSVMASTLISYCRFFMSSLVHQTPSSAGISPSRRNSKASAVGLI